MNDVANYRDTVHSVKSTNKTAHKYS